MTTAPNLRLSRPQWPDHPHYPDQVLLVGSHNSFRRTSELLVRRAESGRDPDALRWTFRYWKSAMRSHEGYEEYKLYPYLTARWGISCDELRDGHHELAEVEVAVLAALDEDDGPATEALVEALTAHDTILQAHLDLEEEIVVPALLALTPREFDAYYSGHITTLLAQLRQN